MALKRASHRVEIAHRRRIPDDVVVRTKSGERVRFIRELACGHEQPEPSGRGYRNALDAPCHVCYPVKS